MPLLAVAHRARLSRLRRSRITCLLGRLCRRRLHGRGALDANTDIIPRPESRAIFSDLGVPLVEVRGRDMLVANDAVAGGSGTDLVPLGTVADHARLGWLGGLGVTCGRWLGRFGGGCAGDADAVVVVCEEAGAVALDSGIPLDEVGRGECSIGRDNLVAGVAGLGLVEVLAGLDDAGLSRRGACGRGGCWLGFGGGSAWDADAVVVAGEETRAVRFDGRVPFDEVVESEGSVVVDDVGAGIARLGLVEPHTGRSETVLSRAGLGSTSGSWRCGRIRSSGIRSFYAVRVADLEAAAIFFDGGVLTSQLGFCVIRLNDLPI